MTVRQQHTGLRRGEQGDRVAIMPGYVSRTTTSPYTYCFSSPTYACELSALRDHRKSKRNEREEPGLATQPAQNHFRLHVLPKRRISIICGWARLSRLTSSETGDKSRHIELQSVLEKDGREREV